MEPETTRGASGGRPSSQIMERVVELAVVAGLAIWCFQIARPFIVPLLWGLIIAVALSPVFDRLVRAVGGRKKVGAALFALLAIGMIILPTFIVGRSLFQTAADLRTRLADDTAIEIPPPPESVREWPVIGETVHEEWTLASQDSKAALEKYDPQIRAVIGSILKSISSFGGGVLHTIIALIIAAILLATAEGGVASARAIGSRLAGDMGRKSVDDAGATIKSVAKGVVGVALIQGLMAGLGLFLAGVPAAGLWTLGVVVLAVIQLPPILLLGPICAWLFSGDGSTTVAILFTIWSIVVSAADGFLKPVFLGRGVDIPMPVILIGAIGGMISMGIIGLFLGAVVLSIGYTLFRAWLKAGESPTASEPAPSPAS